MTSCTVSDIPSESASVLGDAFVDIVAGPIDAFPKWGGDATCERITQFPGGSALNVSVGLSEIVGTYASVC